MAKKYREKHCNEVEAVQWTGKNISEVRNFTIKNRNGVAEQRSYLSQSSLFIMEPDKDVEVSRNDYIVKTDILHMLSPYRRQCMKRLKNQKVYNSRYTSIWRLKLLLKENLQKDIAI